MPLTPRSVLCTAVCLAVLAAIVPAARAGIYQNWTVCPSDSRPTPAWAYAASLPTGTQTAIQATTPSGETLTCVWISTGKLTADYHDSRNN